MIILPEITWKHLGQLYLTRFYFRTTVPMSASRPLNCDGKDNNKKNGSSEFTVSYSHISYSILQSYFHILQFPERMAYEVFLGGSCNPTTWRSEIAIPTLQSLGITYYNPVCISSHNQFSTASFSIWIAKVTVGTCWHFMLYVSASIAMGARTDSSRVRSKTDGESITVCNR